MFTKTSLAIAVGISALLGADAFAQDQATVGIQTTTHYAIDGRIAAVDANARTLTITSADGTNRMLNVSPMAANITSTKVGDNVEVAIEDTRTFVLSSPGVQTPAAGAASAAVAVEISQGGVAGAETLPVDRQLDGCERQPCWQHHHAGQSRWRRSAHLRRDHGRGPSATAAGKAG